MSLELVPAGDERCNVCGGDPSRPAPGEQASLSTAVCDACERDLDRDLEIARRVDGLTPPDDPSVN